MARFPPPSYCLVKARQPASYPSATPGLPVLRLELAKNINVLRNCLFVIDKTSQKTTFRLWPILKFTKFREIMFVLTLTKILPTPQHHQSKKKPVIIRQIIPTANDNTP